ncbi:MAG: M20/M25/M40 family metallo-hydrolase [Myxococcota bacterium]|nr:M20/M25/M40 family metallo-hydrolase [Myxococcota bacterium]
MVLLLTATRPGLADQETESAPVAAPDWDVVAAETAQLLSAYLQVDTTNPPGGETAGARFLADFLEAEGIATELVEPTPGRASLVARIPGRGDEPPLCLLSHTDVVTAEPDRWQHPPLSGHVDDQGRIWGRGALDMKGMGAVEAMVMALVQRREVTLRRDLVLLAVADEEVSNTGIMDVLDIWDTIGCSQVVNEGSMGLVGAFFEGEQVVPISVGEKGFLWMRMVAEGAPGHGSTPRPDEAPERLLRAAAALEHRKVRPHWDPVLLELLAAVGQTHGGLAGFVLQRPWLTRVLLRRKLMSDPLTRAVLTDTVHLTGMAGAREPNVVPSEVHALLDSRLLPGTDPDAIQQLLVELVDDPQVRFERIQAVPSAVSPREDPLYEALARHAAREWPEAAVGPALSPGFTDSIYLRQVGVRAYGLVPFMLDAQALGSMHGDDEWVSIDNLESGVRVLFGAVLDVAADRAGTMAPTGTHAD